jgi:hypothetical protein
MDLSETLKHLGSINLEVQATMAAAEKLGEAVGLLVGEIEKLVTTKAAVNSITIHEED